DKRNSRVYPTPIKSGNGAENHPKENRDCHRKKTYGERYSRTMNNSRKHIASDKICSEKMAPARRSGIINKVLILIPVFDRWPDRRTEFPLLLEIFPIRIHKLVRPAIQMKSGKIIFDNRKIQRAVILRHDRLIVCKKI